MFDYDAELQRYQVHLRATADIGTDDRVLDIGCGAGLTTREAARAASSGSALGVDVSEESLDRARKIAAKEGVANIRFECGDAQAHRLRPEHFTVALSRFGTMFFTNPIAAFSHIGRALRPEGRLVQLVWQAPAHQEWITALAPFRDNAVPTNRGAFSLSDPGKVADVLTAAGFTNVELTDLREPVHYGADATHAYDALVELGMAGGPDDHLLSLLASHDTGAGVWFSSRAWLVTAQRGP